MKKIKQQKDKCINCKKDTLYSKEEHIDFRLGYIEGAGQLCLDCYDVIYGITSELQSKEIGENKNGLNPNR
jgi:hypothetical protein